MNADQWRGLAVAQLTQGGSGFLQACQSAWRDFGQHHGTRLRWVKATPGLVRSARYELRTAEQQTIASRVAGHRTVEAGGRSFTWKKTSLPVGSTAGSWPPGVAELATRSRRDVVGHFAAGTRSGRAPRWVRAVSELVDEAGTPVLYASGRCYDERAAVRVTFPDQRWLRFLVRGTHPENAIMTAVDQAGNRVVRYRRPAEGWDTVEITVNPNWQLTDELILVIAISASYLKSYFDSPHG